MKCLSVVAILMAAPVAVVLAQGGRQSGPGPTPIVRAPGETPVAGKCLFKEDLDLIEALRALTRTTLNNDAPSPFNPDYLVGRWTFEYDMPESALGPAGQVSGTETVRHVDGCLYEGATQAKGPAGAFTIKSTIVYDPSARYLVVLERDSRGSSCSSTDGSAETQVAISRIIGLRRRSPSKARRSASRGLRSWRRPPTSACAPRSRKATTHSSVWAPSGCSGKERPAPSRRAIRMRVRTVLALAIAMATPVLGYAQAPPGPMPIFQDRCATCHMVTPPPGSRAPSLDALRSLSPEAILIALTTGPMAANATDLTEPQRRALADTSLGANWGWRDRAGRGDEKPVPSGIRWETSRRCPAGTDGAQMSTRFPFSTRRACGAQAGRGAPSETEMGVCIPEYRVRVCSARHCGRPIVCRRRKLVRVCAQRRDRLRLLAVPGGASVRSAISVGPITGQPGARYAIYFGDLNGAVFAVNAETGRSSGSSKPTSIRWRASPAPHPSSRAVGRSRCRVRGGRCRQPEDQCCSTQGAIVAYDANTGAQIWRASTVSEPLARTTKTSVGTQLWGPSGGSVWSAPTVDERTQSLYVATGNAFTAPAARTTNAIVAFDLDTGRMRWSKQLTT